MITTLKHAKLQQICARVIEMLADFKEIKLADADYYGSIKAPECYNMTDNPEMVVGSLMDDIEALKKLIDNEERPVTSVDLDLLASVLYAISEGMNPA